MSYGNWSMSMDYHIRICKQLSESSKFSYCKCLSGILEIEIIMQRIQIAMFNLHSFLEIILAFWDPTKTTRQQLLRWRLLLTWRYMPTKLLIGLKIWVYKNTIFIAEYCLFKQHDENKTRKGCFNAT